MRTVVQKSHRTQQSGSAKRAAPRSPPSTPAHGPHAVLHLQRTIGNQAVQRLLRADSGRREIGQRATSAAFQTCTASALDRIQRKLRVSAPGDEYERQADRAALAVLRLPPRERDGARPQPTPRPRPVAWWASESQESPANDAGEPLQTAATPSQALPLTPEMETRILALQGGGQPLPDPVRAEFEPRFGHDFSEVRVHTDSLAAQTAQSLNARAFTVGRDVVFGGGEYAPETATGKRLLAHELVHVSQQTRTAGVSPVAMRQGLPPRGLSARKAQDKYARMARQLRFWLYSSTPSLHETAIVGLLARLTAPEVTRVERAYGQPVVEEGEWNPYLLREDTARILPNGRRIAQWVQKRSELLPKVGEAEAKRASEMEISQRASRMWSEDDRKRSLRKLAAPSQWPGRVRGREGDIILNERTKRQIKLWGEWVITHFAYLVGQHIVTEQHTALLANPDGDLVMFQEVGNGMWNRWVRLNSETAAPSFFLPGMTEGEKKTRIRLARAGIPKLEAFRELFDRTPGPLSDWMKDLVNARLGDLRKWLLYER